MSRNNNLGIVLGIIVLVCSVRGQTETSVRCPLIWNTFSNGDPIPQSAVFAHQDSVYIVRGRTESGLNVIGAYDFTTDPPEAYFPSDDVLQNSTGTTHFELLMNPHGCTLDWKPYCNGDGPSQFFTSADDNPSTNSAIVARGIETEEDPRYFGGGVTKANRGILVAFYADMEPQILTCYDVLVSYSPGLLLEMGNFEFETDPFGQSSDFMGVDFISNDSPATIKQSLTHKKKVTEIHVITTNRTWTSVYTEKFKVRLIFFSVERTKVTTYSHATSERVETRETTEVSVTRDIIVPPYTSVQACSLVSIKESEKVSYTATAKYSAPGLKSTEVLDILKSDGITAATIDGDFVVLTATGEFTAKLAMNTEFLVRNAGASGDCDAIRYRINEENRLKRNNC